MSSSAAKQPNLAHVQQEGILTATALVQAITSSALQASQEQNIVQQSDAKPIGTAAATAAQQQGLGAAPGIAKALGFAGADNSYLMVAMQLLRVMRISTDLWSLFKPRRWLQSKGGQARKISQAACHPKVSVY